MNAYQLHVTQVFLVETRWAHSYVDPVLTTSLEMGRPAAKRQQLKLMKTLMELLQKVNLTSAPSNPSFFQGRAHVPVGHVILESSALRAHTHLLVTYVVRVLLGSAAMDKHARQGPQTGRHH